MPIGCSLLLAIRRHVRHPNPSRHQVLGNFLNTTAVELGGNAVIMAQTYCNDFDIILTPHRQRRRRTTVSHALDRTRCCVLIGALSASVCPNWGSRLCSSIITSGLLGIFYYGEGGILDLGLIFDRFRPIFQHHAAHHTQRDTAVSAWLPHADWWCSHFDCAYNFILFNPRPLGSFAAKMVWVRQLRHYFRPFHTDFSRISQLL